MPIKLITGIPGHGKTARLVKELLAAAEKGDRPIFAAGIDGLKPGLAQELKDPTRWQDCPDGSLIFVDEAWKWFGHLSNPSRQQTPAHVLALAEHRHRGIDFVWTSQGPNQLYPFARPLIEQHWHCIRKFGTHAVDLYKWGELVEDVKSQGMRDRAEKETTTLPSETFGLYKSASEHTIKSRIPWKVWLIPACVVAGAVLIWLAYSFLRPDAMAAQLTGKGASGEAAAPEGLLHYNPSERQKKPLTDEEWLGRITPRFPGMHESMPIFDGREVQAVPRRFCVISGEGSDMRCNCYTEQVTLLRDIPPGVCLEVARWGEYDPFRAPPEPGQLHQAQEAQPVATRPPAGTGSLPSSVGTPRQGEVWGRAPETLR